MDVRIHRFRAEHAPAFEALNRAWLVDHGLYEGRDEEQLADPWGAIINPGGQIFVALLDNEVIGTCAVLSHGSGTFELAKLVVAPAARGHGLGRQLVDACLSHARQRHMQRVVLVSNSRLGPAIRLYEGMGFQHRPLPADVPYATADVYMELDLAASATGMVEHSGP
jgi:ribosomal protein S18 acetylase RimI-like enzyme